MSLRLWLLNAGLRRFVKPVLQRLKDPEAARAHLERSARRGHALIPRMRIVPDEVRGPGGPIAVEWVSSKKADRRSIIIYVHGGAYIMGSPQTHRAITSVLARESDFRIMVPDYRLAPEHPCPAAVEDVLACYSSLLAQGYAPEQIALAGESAGGGLVLAILGLIEAKGFPMPACVLAYSPSTDLSFSGPSVTSNLASEVMLPAERAQEIAGYYLGEGIGADDPLASPLFMTLNAPPPVFISAGSGEILLDDARVMAERLREQGGETALDIRENLPHAAPFFALIVPEALGVVRRSVEFLRRHTES